MIGFGLCVHGWVRPSGDKSNPVPRRFHQVNLTIPLGAFYVVKGAKPKPNRAYGAYGSVSLFFDLLAHLRC